MFVRRSSMKPHSLIKYFRLPKHFMHICISFESRVWPSDDDDDDKKKENEFPRFFALNLIEIQNGRRMDYG